MTLTVPYPADLLRIARKVVWYDQPEQTLADLDTYLAHLMVYGSSADVAVTGQYVPTEEFRMVLENAPADCLHKRLGRNGMNNSESGEASAKAPVSRWLVRFQPRPYRCVSDVTSKCDRLEQYHLSSLSQQPNPVVEKVNRG